MALTEAMTIGRRQPAARAEQYVPAGPSRAHLERLRAAGVPLNTLGRATGLSQPQVRAILDGSRTRVRPTTAALVQRTRLADVYRRQGGGHVPKIGAVRRVQALMAMGWPRTQLEAAGATSLPRVLSGSGHLISQSKWAQIARIYDQLAMTAGPSTLARRHAEINGYPPPLAWDDDTIDDPRASPQHQLREPDEALIDPVAIERVIHGDRAVGLTQTERLHVVDLLAAAGVSDAAIAQRLGISDRTVLRYRHREDNSDNARGTGPGAVPVKQDQVARPDRGMGVPVPRLVPAPVPATEPRRGR